MGRTIVCHQTGVQFDFDAVPRNPVRRVPGTTIPLDVDAVDQDFPIPESGSLSPERAAQREQALADVETYAKAAAESGKAPKPARAGK